MATASPLTSLRHRGPITFTPNHFPSPFKTSKISALHVTTTTTMSTPPHPSLEIIGGATDSILPLLNSTHLTRPYDPFPFIGWNCHMETIYASFYRSLPDVRLRRECLRTKDNGSVSLDWVSGDDRHLPSDSPLLILLVRLLFTLFSKTLFNLIHILYKLNCNG